MQGAGCKEQDAGSRMQGAGCREQDAGSREDGTETGKRNKKCTANRHRQQRKDGVLIVVTCNVSQGTKKI